MMAGLNLNRAYKAFFRYAGYCPVPRRARYRPWAAQWFCWCPPGRIRRRNFSQGPCGVFSRHRFALRVPRWFWNSCFPRLSTSGAAQCAAIHQVTKLLDGLNEAAGNAAASAGLEPCGTPKPRLFPVTTKGQALRDFAVSRAGSRGGRVGRLSGSYRGKLSKNMVTPVRIQSNWTLNLGSRPASRRQRGRKSL